MDQPDGSIKIKATTTATTDQTFTYNVNYTNSNFTNGLTKTVNAKVAVNNFNYKLEIGDNHPTYTNINTVKTLNKGDYFSTPNNVIRMVRLTLDGIPVKMASGGGTWTQFSFGQTPISSSDITISNYGVTLYDYTNLRSVTIPLNLTLTNSAYSRIVGNTFTVKHFRNNSLVNTQTISFKNDGTYTKLYSDGTSAGSGNYSFSKLISPSYVVCTSYIINDDVAGAIYLPAESQNVSIPNYFIINSNNTIKANSSYGCDDSWERWGNSIKLTILLNQMYITVKSC